MKYYKEYKDKNGEEICAGDYIRFSEKGEPQRVYEWEDSCGTRGLGTDATNPAWIKSGRACPCEFGIYDITNEDMKYCELVGREDG